MNEPAAFQKRWIFRPLFLLVIWGFFALLLVANGFFEAKRARDNLFRLLADEGAAILEGLSRSAQNSLASLAALETMPEAALLAIYSPVNILSLEEAVIDWVLEIANQIDRRLGREEVTPERLEAAAKEEKIAGVEVIRAGTRLSFQRGGGVRPGEERPPFYEALIQGKASYAIQRSEKRGTGQMDFLSAAIVRKAGEGILVVHAGEGDIQHLRRRVVLQGIIDEWAGKGDIRYLRFQGKDGELWAGFDSREGEKNEGGGVFEASRPVSFDAAGPGVLRVGLNTEKVDRIIRGDIRNLILFSLLLLTFGGIGILLISRLENRHLARMREMEERVHQSEKLSSLANLAGGVAHEIRNPLNAIGLAIQRLQREFPPENPELRKEYFHFTDVLRGEVKRVNEIIEQFLFFSRPARLDLRPLRLKGLFRDLAALAQEPARERGVSLEEDADPDLPPVEADRQRLQEALWNLIQNGLQAMSGGGKLRLGARLQKGDQIEIEIADTGEGIPEENLGKVFDYYFTTKEKGVGLGLPLAHKIIEGHGGSIRVRSRAGQGTSFSVFLPVSKEKK